MDLITKDLPASLTKSGRQVIELTNPKILKIETSPDGMEILNAAVPEGKKWTVYLNLDIHEANI